MILLALTMIQIYLAVLRLTNTIDWSWFLVLVPYTIVMLLVIVGALTDNNKTDEWEKAREEWRKVSKQ